MSWQVSDVMRECFDPEDGLESENVQHESFSSRQNGQLCFWHILIRSRLLPQKPCRRKLAAVNSNLAGESFPP